MKILQLGMSFGRGVCVSWCSLFLFCFFFSGGVLDVYAEDSSVQQVNNLIKKGDAVLARMKQYEKALYSEKSDASTQALRSESDRIRKSEIAPAMREAKSYVSSGGTKGSLSTVLSELNSALSRGESQIQKMEGVAVQTGNAPEGGLPVLANSTLAGSGIPTVLGTTATGAVIGQLAGGDTEATLIGAGAGAAAGLLLNAGNASGQGGGLVGALGNGINAVLDPVADGINSVQGILTGSSTGNQGLVFDGPGLERGAKIVRRNLDQSISHEDDLKKLIIAWTRFLFSIAATVAVVALIWAGFLYITAFGDDARMESAKKIIIWTVLGILLVFGAYAIVNTVMQAVF